jgi:hypothetical protein
MGTVVWSSMSTGKSPALVKGVYWVLNSLVIFVVGFGTSYIAAGVTSPSRSNRAHSLPFVSTALAQDKPDRDAPLPAESGQQEGTVEQPAGSEDVKELQKELEQERAKNRQLKEELETDQQEIEQEKTKPTEQKKDRPFFKRW